MPDRSDHRATVSRFLAGDDSPRDANFPSSGSKSDQAYVWLDCASHGWQVLVPSRDLGQTIPEPPRCVADSPRRSSPISSRVPSLARARDRNPSSAGSTNRPDWIQPRSQSPNARAGAANSPTATDASMWQGNLRRESSTSPSPRARTPPAGAAGRNYVRDNKMVTQSGRSKASLLDEAVSQIRESELIGNSLAERLKQIHRKLNH